MGWRDAPIVKAPAWASAPLIDAEDINAAGASQFGVPPQLSVDMNNVPLASPQMPQQGGIPPLDPLAQEAARTGSGQAYLIGAGRTMDKMGAGIHDLALTPSAFAGNEDARAKRALLAQEQSEKDRIYAPLSKAKPRSTFAGEMTPYVLSPRKMPGVSQAASNVLIPGAMGFSEFDSANERLQKGAAGAAAGLLGNVGARGVGGRPTPTGMDPHIEQTIRRGEELGFRVVPSVKRESRDLQIKEAGMISNPRTSDIASAAGEHNERQLTRIAARAIGLDDVDRLTPGNMDRARRGIGREFDQAGEGVTIGLDDAFRQDVSSVAEKYSEGAGRRSKKIQNIIDDLLGYGDTMTPEQYRRQISTLATDARSAAARDSGKSRAMYEIREALDQAFDRSTTQRPPIDENSARFSQELRDTLNDFNGGREGQLQAFREARARWRSLMDIEGAVTEAGDVRPDKLASTIRRNDKSGYVYGNRESDLYDAIRFLKIFPKQFGRPGTAEAQSGKVREGLLATIRDPALAGAGIGGAVAGAEGATIGGLLGAGVGIANPAKEKLAAQLYYSQALNRGLLPMSESAQGLLSSGLTKALTPGLLSLP